MDNLNIALVFGAGLASVLSPCVLPVVPIVVTGTDNDHRLRPVMIVLGLSLAFVAMGVVSSLFGSLIGTHLFLAKRIAGVFIALFGLLLIFNVNLFKHASFLSNIAGRTRGKVGGFLLGLTLGIVWIPCVGPMLSGVLALVASQGKVVTGIVFLLVYSAGFAVPMLVAGYASQFFRVRFKKIGKFHVAVNIASGAILIALGVFVYFHGATGFGF
jgi:cytochrome c-type biogenesis protein